MANLTANQLINNTYEFIDELDDICHEIIQIGELRDIECDFQTLRNDMKGVTNATDEDIQNAPRRTVIGFIRQFDNERRCMRDGKHNRSSRSLPSGVPDRRW